MTKIFLIVRRLYYIPLYIYAMIACVYIYFWVLFTYKGVPDLNSLENRLAIDKQLETKFGSKLTKLHERLITAELKLESKFL